MSAKYPTKNRYTWQPGTPEGDAMHRFDGKKPTLEDLFVMAIAECTQAMDALPPEANAPQSNNAGEIWQSDPWHASACVLRAYAMIRRIQTKARGMHAALTKINEIRNSIVGAQTFNFSEHAYPLVEALKEAGFEGLPYPEARANVGTLIERATKSEAEVVKLRTALEALVNCVRESAPLTWSMGGLEAQQQAHAWEIRVADTLRACDAALEVTEHKSNAAGGESEG